MELITPLLSDATASLGIALVVSSNTPLVLLDENLVVVVASTSFCLQFGLLAENVARRSLFELGAGEWNIPQLKSLLHATVSGSAAIESYAFDLSRKDMPRLNLTVHARKLEVPLSPAIYIVLALADVTQLRLADKLKDDLLRDKQTLLNEVQHRVANSLQIIASVLMQSARNVQSTEASLYLRNAHHRVMSIATLQRMLATRSDNEVAIATYLTDLCSSIAASMIADPTKLKLVVTCDDSRMSADQSISIGLIVTELVINSLKHGYLRKSPEGTIGVSYNSKGAGWVLSVIDDGVGMPALSDRVKPGLGTGIVEALASQLDAEIIVSDGKPGTIVTITHYQNSQAGLADTTRLA